MTLNPLQFLKDHMTDNTIGRPEAPTYALGAQVHDVNGRPGFVTAHHIDHRHYNVRFGRSDDVYVHEDELH